MKKILINFIREQKKHLLQFYGLAALTIIMVSSFLTLIFASNYLTNQYVTDIAKGQLHQETSFSLNPTFRLNKELVNKKTLFENMVVYEGQNKNDAVISGEKFSKNTWRLEELKDKNGIYRFHFGSLDNKEKKAQPKVGQSLVAKTNKTFLDFKISIPITYPTLKDHKNEVERIKKIFNKYTNYNKLNYFIFDDKTLEYFQKNIEADSQLNPDKVTYKKEDINNHALLYQSIITGALYGTNNLSWRRDFNHKDVLFSNKMIHFIQYTPGEIYNYPIVTGSTPDLGNNPLEDDEILVYEAFAAKNNLVIGSSFFYYGKWYKIRGFATSILAAAPNTYFGTAIDFKNQTIGFVNKNTFDKLQTDPFLLESKNGYFYGVNPDLGSINREYNNYWLYQYLHESIDPNLDWNKKLCFNAIDIVSLLNPLQNWISIDNYNEITETSVWNTIKKLKDMLLTIGYTFLNIIFVIVSVITLMLITKIIDRNKAALGILKANGYRNHNISLIICSAIIFPLIIFIFIGIISAIFISHIVILNYKVNLALINYGWAFEFKITLFVLIIPITALWIISLTIISYLLKKKPIALINSNLLQDYSFNGKNAKQKWKLAKNMSYRNKIALTLMKRNFIKNICLTVTSFFASILFFFSLSATGMINNLIANNYRNTNYNYETIYNIPPNQEFINEKGEKIYEKRNITDIKKLHANNKNPLLTYVNDALDNILAKNNLAPNLSFDLRNHYLTGKDLATIYQKIETFFLKNNNVPSEWRNIWKESKIYFDYFSKNENLLVTFGLMPYDEKQENPIIKFEFKTRLFNGPYYKKKKNLDISDKKITYNFDTRSVIAINDKTSNYLSINLQQSNMNTFSNLTLDKIKNNSYNHLNKRFLKKYHHFAQLNYTAYGKPVPIIPIIKSKQPFWTNRKVDNYDYILFDITTINGEQKYILGLTYDTSNDLSAHENLVPQTWFANTISAYKQQTIPDFSNNKLSKLKNYELKNYLPIINLKNNYNIDIYKLLSDRDFFSKKNFVSAVNNIIDIAVIKQIYNNLYDTIKLIILLFSSFSLILCFVIIIIISNININDNLRLVLTLKSLGYKNNEITYILTIFTIPILLISATFSIYAISIFAENLAKIVSNMIQQYASIIFYWWYIILTFAIILTIYFASYIITWKITIKKDILTTLTK